MVEGSTRRLPKWLAIGNEVERTNKKKTSEENKLRAEPEENPAPPRNSLSLAKKGTKRKRGNLFKHGDLHHTTVNVSRGKKRKRKAKNVAFGTQEEIDALTPTHDHILDDGEDSLTVEDLVSIAREYVKDSEDSEQSLLLSRNGQPSSSNVLDGSNEQQFSSGETRASIGTTVNLTSEQSFINFSRTDDPAQDMLHLFLGPLLEKPQGKEMDLDLVYESQKQSQNDSREEMIPLTKKKSSLKDKVSFLLDRI